MKKHKKLIIAIVLILLAAAWIWRYITMNKYYDDLDNGDYKLYQMGEMVPFENDGLDSNIDLSGCYIQATGFELQNCDALLNETGLILSSKYIKPEKLALVNITLKNDSSDEKLLTLMKIGLHGVDTNVTMNGELLCGLNPRLNGRTSISLSPGEVCTLVLPYDIYRSQFGSSTWRNIEEYKFLLKVTTALTQKEILVNR